MGDFYYRAGRKNEAKRHYRSIIQKNPSNTEPAAIGQYLLAELYDKDGLNDSAKNEYLKVKENNPGVLNWAILGEYSNAMCYYNEWALLSDSLMRDTVRIKTVTGKLQSFIDSYPTDKRTPRAMMTLAGVYDRIGEYEKSVEEFNRIISFNESLMSNISPEVKQQELKAHRELVEKAHMSKAVTLKQSLNRSEDALNEYEIVIAGNPMNYDAMLGKAMTLIQMERRQEAKAILLELSSMDIPQKQIAQSLINTL